MAFVIFLSSGYYADPTGFSRFSAIFDNLKFVWSANRTWSDRK